MRSSCRRRRSSSARPAGSAPTNYADLYRSFGFPLDDLAEQCRRLLAETEDLWEEAGDRFFRSRVGIGLDEIKRWDVGRAWRGADWDAAFPPDRMLPALEVTLAELGIDLRAQQNVELDLEERPSKDPRAFCSPIEVPGRVVLVMKPQGGPDDWRDALPRGRPHRALRAHVRFPLAGGASGSATTPSPRAGRCCSST